MLIPYSTDAPIYHRPWVTWGLIGVNVLVFLATFGLMESPDTRELVTPWMLELGGGIHPLQWVTANFLHAGLTHLAGNMFFLYAFGLIVEGKIGWWRFLVVYLSLGVLVQMVLQFVSLAFEPNHALGASGAIFGLLAIALVWAPENEISCILLISIYAKHVDIKVLVMACLYLGIQVVFLGFGGLKISSELIHMLGAIFGFGVGVLMLRLQWVDCENWDVFSVLAGRHTMSEDALAAKTLPAEPQESPDPAKVEEERASALAQIEKLTADGQVKLALIGHEAMRKRFPDWRLPQPIHGKLLAACFRNQDEIDPVPLAVEYLRNFPGQAKIVRLRLAETLIVKQQRPMQAHRVLAKLRASDLNPQELAVFKRLQQQAVIQRESGALELAAEDW